MDEVSLQQEALGESDHFLEFQRRLSRAAQVDRPVLLIGERGTGKELAASRLHYLSRRWEGPLVALNCSALSQNLIETELFGHEAGAFTGAAGKRKGRFEEAHSGTLFLDEIGLVPLEVQEKILRVVEYGRFERVGSSRPIEVDVRIVGATNADLPGLCEEGRFKRDLLDRLSFEVLFLPPLRERGPDIMLLARFFAERMQRELGRSERLDFSPAVEEALMAHPWPGNIRELKNVVERAVYRCEEGRIDGIDLDPFANPFHRCGGEEVRERPGLMEQASPLERSGPLEQFHDEREALEVRYLKAALEREQYNQRRAAAALNLSYDQFRGLYRKYQKKEMI